MRGSMCVTFQTTKVMACASGIQASVPRLCSFSNRCCDFRHRSDALLQELWRIRSWLASATLAWRRRPRNLLSLALTIKGICLRPSCAAVSARSCESSRRLKAGLVEAMPEFTYLEGVHAVARRLALAHRLPGQGPYHSAHACKRSGKNLQQR